MRSLEPSLIELRRDSERTQRKLSRLASQLQTLQRHLDRLTALRSAERHHAARIEELERTLDVDRVDRHMRAAVEQAGIFRGPIPHLWISDLLPADVYQAILEAVPAPVFLDDGPEGRHDFPVPPRMLPSYAIVTWEFMTDVAHRPLADLLLARFQPFLAADAASRFPDLPPFDEWDVEITVSADRIVRRRHGGGGAMHARPWTLLSGILDLAKPDDHEEFGSRLGPTLFPFRPNSALVFLGSAGAHEYLSIPHDAAANLERYSYEFDIGPTRDGRRRLAQLRQSTGARDSTDAIT